MWRGVWEMRCHVVGSGEGRGTQPPGADSRSRALKRGEEVPRGGECGRRDAASVRGAGV